MCGPAEVAHSAAFNSQVHAIKPLAYALVGDNWPLGSWWHVHKTLVHCTTPTPMGYLNWGAEQPLALHLVWTALQHAQCRRPVSGIAGHLAAEAHPLAQGCPSGPRGGPRRLEAEESCGRALEWSLFC